jgi:hypothetical protein
VSLRPGGGAAPRPFRDPSEASPPCASKSKFLSFLEDPSGLFNSSLDGNTRRAIDFHEGEKIDEEALKALIRAAVTLNASRAHG